MTVGEPEEACISNNAAMCMYQGQILSKSASTSLGISSVGSSPSKRHTKRRQSYRVDGKEFDFGKEVVEYLRQKDAKTGKELQKQEPRVADLCTAAVRPATAPEPRPARGTLRTAATNLRLTCCPL